MFVIFVRNYLVLNRKAICDLFSVENLNVMMFLEVWRLNRFSFLAEESNGITCGEQERRNGAKIS